MVPENIETGSNYEDIGRWQYPKFIRFWLSNGASAFVTPISPWWQTARVAVHDLKRSISSKGYVDEELVATLMSWAATTMIRLQSSRQRMPG